MGKEITDIITHETTLFVGLGGIGSVIVKNVIKKSRNDNTENCRFVVLSNDPEEIARLQSEDRITAVQTMMSGSVSEHLANCGTSRDWFPENKKFKDRSLSEAVDNARAGSRLALDSCIRSNEFLKLYKVIDELANKGGLNQTMRVVVIANNAAVMSSGSAMLTAMLIRDYCKENYRDMSVIISGFLILPGALYTVVGSQSERETLNRNAYAAIREISAFTLKSSGDFYCDKNLRRYSGLSIEVPSEFGDSRKLENLPFDFCILADRPDDNPNCATGLMQYIDAWSQSIYERNIGPLSRRISIREDGIERSLAASGSVGNRRFAGIGSSVLRYPIEEIKEYIAYNQALECISGITSDGDDENGEGKVTGCSWLQYDRIYHSKCFDYDMNRASSSDGRPVLSDVYVNEFNTMQDELSKALREECLSLASSRDRSAGSFGFIMECVVSNYIKCIVDKTVQIIKKNVRFAKLYDAFFYDVSSSYTQLFRAVDSISRDAGGYAKEIADSFAEAVFNNTEKIQKISDDYMPESLLKKAGGALHPNAMRYMLYRLRDGLQKAKETYGSRDFGWYLDDISDIVGTGTFAKDNEKKFAVPGMRGKETTLKEMCEALDASYGVGDKLNSNAKRNCKMYLQEYLSCVEQQCRSMAFDSVCDFGLKYTDRLISQIEAFYDSLYEKSKQLQKIKSSILSDLEFHDGDCVRNVCVSKTVINTFIPALQLPINAKRFPGSVNALIFDTFKHNVESEQNKEKNPGLSDKIIDVFDDIVLDYFLYVVNSASKGVIDMNIFQAIEVEYSFEKSDIIGRDDPVNPVSQKDYTDDIIRKTRALASPGLGKNDMTESNYIFADAYSTEIDDDEIAHIREYIPAPLKCNNMSKFEINFFNGIYNLSPAQLPKFRSNAVKDFDGNVFTYDETLGTNGGEDIDGGEYFRSYQKYMDYVEPDCRTSRAITPHIDKRWDSVTVMPELDYNYQCVQTKRVHSAFIYGLLYGVISFDYYQNSSKKIYVYQCGDDEIKKLSYPNKPECTVLSQVLEALYYDRAAVKTINRFAEAKRMNDRGRHFGYEETSFAKGMGILSERLRLNGFDSSDGKASMFDIPLMYYNSLPDDKKDSCEITEMPYSVIRTISDELRQFVDGENYDDKLAEILTEQFEIFIGNYKNEKNRNLSGDIPAERNPVVQNVYRCITSKLSGLMPEGYDEEETRLKKLIVD